MIEYSSFIYNFVYSSNTFPINTEWGYSFGSARGDSWFSFSSPLGGATASSWGATAAAGDSSIGASASLALGKGDSSFKVSVDAGSSASSGVWLVGSVVSLLGDSVVSLVGWATSLVGSSLGSGCASLAWLGLTSSALESDSEVEGSLSGTSLGASIDRFSRESFLFSSFWRGLSSGDCFCSSTCSCDSSSSCCFS